ncbi:hypothetical protein BRADI_2g24640v3 [Brachypodium distachyon]|uniref:Uncharacterized protein n=1 Tax=Brachypodium distachyon TaxID=15368 RepID=A0A0Q3G6Q1_BRADI|nr:hypothetical protein BRADI_2g24640v3 [Brachypodium distachyon]
MAVVTVVALAVLGACAWAAAAVSSAGALFGEEGGEGGVGREATYDGRALVLNGTRRILFSGEMHYTRSTPEYKTLPLQ